MNIVKVRYNIEKDEGREYSYYSEDSLLIGDIVNVPTKNGLLKARVSAINVSEEEVAPYKDALRTIPAGSLIKSTFDPAPLDMGIKKSSEVSEEEWRDAIKPETPPGTVDLTPEGKFLALHKNLAVIKVAPEKDNAVQQVYLEGLRLLEYAQSRVIKNLDDLKLANNDLAIISNLKKSIEEARKEYTSPINQHLHNVNDAFKKFTEPLNMADELNRTAVKAFHNEQERIQREQEEINRKRMEAAQQEMALKGELSEPVQEVEVIPAAKRVTTESGTTGMVDNWKYEVTDFGQLPDEYKVADHAVLSAIARKHHDKKPVPGVRFYNEPTVRVKSK